MIPLGTNEALNVPLGTLGKSLLLWSLHEPQIFLAPQGSALGRLAQLGRPAMTTIPSVLIPQDRAEFQQQPPLTIPLFRKVCGVSPGRALCVDTDDTPPPPLLQLQLNSSFPSLLGTF